MLLMVMLVINAAILAISIVLQERNIAPIVIIVLKNLITIVHGSEIVLQKEIIVIFFALWLALHVCFMPLTLLTFLQCLHCLCSSQVS